MTKVERLWICGVCLFVCATFLVGGALTRDPAAFFLSILAAACFDAYRGQP